MGDSSYALVLGVLSTEHLLERRQRLRFAYRDADQHHVLVRFVFSAEWLRLCAHSRRTHALRAGCNNATHRLGVLAQDEVAVSTGQHSWTKGLGPWEQLCSRERIMALKTVGWLIEAALRWPAQYYGATDDDAVIDLEPMLAVLHALPRTRPVWAGVMNYGYLNEETLSWRRRNQTRSPSWLPRRPCVAAGALGALKLRRHGCNGGGGPYPFALGSLKLMSYHIASWARERLVAVQSQLLARRHIPADAANCPAGEDMQVGHVVAQFPSLSMVNLGKALGAYEIEKRAGKRRVPAWLAHKVTTSAEFESVLQDFNTSRQNWIHFCDTERSHRRQRAAQRRFCHSRQLQLECVPWNEEMPQIREFTCCRNWHVCLMPPVPLHPP